MPEIARRAAHTVKERLRNNPVVALLGARQVGKTTLARAYAASVGRATWIDLEDDEDRRLLSEENAQAALTSLRGLVVIDEVQRVPHVFPLLRVLADRPRTPARFLLLGNASPTLVNRSSESLAGRISHVELGGFDLAEVDSWERLWLRGGFPRAYLARAAEVSARWRRDLVRTFLARDLPELGIGVAVPALARFWAMLAHVHGQLLNWSELGRAMGADDHTVKRYVDVLVQTFMVRALQPWHENISKRQVKSPKLYFRDAGLLHQLLPAATQRALLSHPKVGASFEGFVIEQLHSLLEIESGEAFFWRTHDGTELDLLVVKDGKRRGFEIKLGSDPSMTRSMHHALADLKLDSLDVIHGGARTWRLNDRVRAIAIADLARELRRG